MTAAPTSPPLLPAGPRRRIVFWRHGRTLWNAERRFQGQSDIPLDEVGRLQAARSASLLAGRLAASPQPGVRLVSSDLSRAMETAGALAGLTGVELVTDPRLRETFAGVWEGKTFEEIERDHPADLKLWQMDEPGIRAGGGESRKEVAGRMREGVLDAVAQVPEGGTLIITTHGGATRVGLARLLGLPEHLWRTLSGLSNCHWSTVEQELSSLAGPEEWQWRLIEHNVGTLPAPYEKPEDLELPVED